MTDAQLLQLILDAIQTSHQRCVALLLVLGEQCLFQGVVDRQ
ncbi:hypothetical protein SAHL_17460 [Salinisphaera orenii YIM 95161]|uniref:Uncharacterized protein n=1 Tax=Salinisphaera orenii YIM 95161 TaxID=1051139 RepID=A0A423PDD8_9GAMM|nr:hypothetical protein SAHL_17460 [Salinisphaera halophila YIM 95161]